MPDETAFEILDRALDFKRFFALDEQLDEVDRSVKKSL